MQLLVCIFVSNTQLVVTGLIRNFDIILFNILLPNMQVMTHNKTDFHGHHL